jgi:hypothetical protein
VLYEYKMIQMPPTIAVQAKAAHGQEAAAYLENVVNEWASRGWEFFRVDTLGVITAPGCLAGLLGAKANLIEYFVVTMRRPRQA